MPITVPEPTSLASLASLDQVLRLARRSDAERGRQIYESLKRAADEYNELAATRNALEAAYQSALAALLEEVDDMLTRAQALHPFEEPDEDPDPRLNAIGRLDAAIVACDHNTVAGALGIAKAKLARLALPSAPSVSVVNQFLAQANEFQAYLAA